MTARAIALAAAVGAVAPSAIAQQHLGEDHFGGMHWHVAAPQGASWTLVCRFRPVTVAMSHYDRQHWANVLRREGRGPMPGRMPSDNGRCTVAKTGGAGPVGIAMIKNGRVQAAGTNDPSRPAVVNVF